MIDEICTLYVQLSGFIVIHFKFVCFYIDYIMLPTNRLPHRVVMVAKEKQSGFTLISVYCLKHRRCDQVRTPSENHIGMVLH
jgi:hypothetical protein